MKGDGADPVSRTVVLDASAVLALLHDEPGADQVELALGDAVMSSVNWAEVAGVLDFMEPEPATPASSDGLQWLPALSHHRPNGLRFLPEGDEVEQLRRHLQDGNAEVFEVRRQVRFVIVDAVGREDDLLEHGAGLQGGTKNPASLG